MPTFNPDDYLVTAAGRVYTEERNQAAWERIYSELEARFEDPPPGTRLYVVFGVQGGGKSSWIAANRDRLGPSAVFLDAALPARRHRARALELARRFEIPAVAVWVNVPLERALERNARRPADEQVPVEALRNVFSLIEPPSPEEGFAEVLEVSDEQ